MKHKILTITGPSGVGKSVLAAYLQEEAGLVRCITCTNRTPRLGEKDGVDYFFLTDDEFEQAVKNGEMVEYDYHYGFGYGIRQADIQAALSVGHVLLVLNWAGAKSVESLYQASSIFVAPLSLDQLEQRLVGRSGHGDRLQFAQEDLAHQKAFKSVLINDDLAQAKADLLAWALQELGQKR